jgi:hypothetical protein
MFYIKNKVFMVSLFPDGTLLGFGFPFVTPKNNFLTVKSFHFCTKKSSLRKNQNFAVTMTKFLIRVRANVYCGKSDG